MHKAFTKCNHINILAHPYIKKAVLALRTARDAKAASYHYLLFFTFFLL